MPGERQAVDSDWDNERVTVGRSFLRDMEGLWSEVLKLAAVVEDALNQSIHALCDGRVEMADELKDRKQAVDRWEVQIERECVGSSPCTNRLPLICDESPPCSRSTPTLNGFATWPGTLPSGSRNWRADPQAFPIPQTLENLALEALAQVHDSLDALTQSNVSRAQAVIAADQQVDRDYRAVQKQLKLEIVRSPERINTWLRLVNTARNLERIADHAAKIAESVIYLKEGEILRHRPADPSRSPRIARWTARRS